MTNFVSANFMSTNIVNYKILRLSEYVRAERDSNLMYTVRETNEYALKTGFD